MERSKEIYYNVGIGILRYGLVGLLLLWGSFKFFAFEANAIQPLVEHSPLLGWLLPVFGLRATSDISETSTLRRSSSSACKSAFTASKARRLPPNTSISHEASKPVWKRSVVAPGGVKAPKVLLADPEDRPAEAGSPGPLKLKAFSLVRLRR